MTPISGYIVYFCKNIYGKIFIKIRFFTLSHDFIYYLASINCK